jgi:hypothetical protein
MMLRALSSLSASTSQRVQSWGSRPGIIDGSGSKLAVAFARSSSKQRRSVGVAARPKQKDPREILQENDFEVSHATLRDVAGPSSCALD